MHIAQIFCHYIFIFRCLFLRIEQIIEQHLFWCPFLFLWILQFVVHSQYWGHSFLTFVELYHMSNKYWSCLDLIAILSQILMRVLSYQKLATIKQLFKNKVQSFYVDFFWLSSILYFLTNQTLNEVQYDWELLSSVNKLYHFIHH